MARADERPRGVVGSPVVEELPKMSDEPKTPSMDDKDTPSPPTRTTEQYEADKEKGIQPVGHATDKKG